MFLDRMPQGFVGKDAVVVLSADLFAFDEASFFQISDDPLHSSLRDADPRGHGAEDQ